MSGTRLALLGLGGISQAVHLPVIQRNRADVELVAVAELSASRRDTIASRWAVPEEGWFRDAEELVAAVSSGALQVDAAIVATTGGHTQETLALVAAGVRVLVEKPLGWSLRELDALDDGLTEAGRSANEWVRVGYMKEYDSAVAAAREILSEVHAREVRIEVLHPADEKQLRYARLERAPADLDPQLLADLGARQQQSITDAVGTDDPILRKLWSNVVLGSIIHDIALTRHLGFRLASVSHARRWTDSFPGSVIASGETTDHVPWNLGWHFIADYPEYRETITIHHERGSVELEFRTPYVLNAPTMLRLRSGGDDLDSTFTEQVWPQEEAFEREFRTLLGMARGRYPEGSSVAAARLDLVSAQALWMACATHAGIRVDPGCEAARSVHPR